MLVFGGTTVNENGDLEVLDDGGLYNPLADKWTTLPSTQLIPAIGKPQLVWSGNELIVWSGWQGGTAYTGKGAVLTLRPEYYQ